MSVLIDISRQFWARSILVRSGPSHTRVHDWLSHGSSYSPTADGTRRHFLLTCLDNNEFGGAWVRDQCRLARACFESARALSIHPKLPDSTAWQIVQAYYTAFFAANTIMRLHGVAICYLDKPTILSIHGHIRSLGYGAVNNPEKGSYRITFGEKSNLVEGQASPSKGGAHGDFWFEFARFIEELIDLVSVAAVAPTKDKNIVIRMLADLETLLSPDPTFDGGWLSHVRNSVNYRQELGTWFPYAVKTLPPHQISKNFSRGFLEEPEEIVLGLHHKAYLGNAEAVVDAFISGAPFLMSWCRCAIEEVMLAAGAPKLAEYKRMRELLVNLA